MSYYSYQLNAFKIMKSMQKYLFLSYFRSLSYFYKTLSELLHDKGLKTKIVNALEDLKSNPNKEADRRTLIIVAILVLVFLFINNNELRQVECN